MNSVIISININENIEYKYHTTAGQLLLSFKISFRIMQDGSKVIRGTHIEKSNPSEYPQSIKKIFLQISANNCTKTLKDFLISVGSFFIF